MEWTKERDVVEVDAGQVPPRATRPELRRVVIARRDAGETVKGAEQIRLAERDGFRDVGISQLARIAGEKLPLSELRGGDTRLRFEVGPGFDATERRRRGRADLERLKLHR